MKRVLAVLIVAFGLFLWTGEAMAYTINDGLSGLYGPGDAIEGTQGQFESYGIDVSQIGNSLKIDLYTSFDGYEKVGSSTKYWETHFADVAISVDGVANGYEYGFTLKSYPATNGTVSGALYSVASWYTSDNHKNMDSVGSGGYVWGYGIITTVASGTVSSTPGYTITATDFANSGQTIGGDTTDYIISFQIALSNLGLTAPGDYTLSLLWGTATCGNDLVAGSTTVHVPEPSTMLLLGLGLVGLVGFGRKKFH